MNNHRDHLIYLLGRSEMYLITFPNLAVQMKTGIHTSLWVWVWVCAHVHTQPLLHKTLQANTFRRTEWRSCIFSH